MQPFTLLIKPSGSDCNMDCRYCFYKNRPAISPATCGQGLPPASSLRSRFGGVGQVRGLNGKQRMSEEVLEKLIKDYMQLDFSPAVFIWQGGEPTLMGLDFYKKAVELQKKHGAAGQEVANCLQTNAILLDDQWCRFLHENNFLVGISIDGPKELHDYYRKDRSGCGTFDKVMKAIEKCKEHKVKFNAITLLNNRNVEKPDEIFDFFIEYKVEYLQLIPCVEQDPTTGQAEAFSITPHQYGEFLCKLFDRWYDYGHEKIRIRDFDSILSYYLTGKHTICTFDKQCNQYIVIEHNGDAFCCDFFVEPRWRLGNIFETPIEKLADDRKKLSFARAKLNLSNNCLLCRHLDVCRGGCMKDRAVEWALNHQLGSGGASPTLPSGYSILDEHQESRIQNQISYFCEAYKRFFDYTMPRFLQILIFLSKERRQAVATGTYGKKT